MNMNTASNFMLFFFIYTIISAFFAPIFHEWVKARVSTILGDTTPRDRGFITWNPMKFFEPIGFFLMVAFQVGWAQPVPTSALYYKDRRKGVILTHIVPIATSLFLGLLIAFIVANVSMPFHMIWFLSAFSRANIAVAVINILLPVHPFALNRLLPLFVSPETTAKLNHYEKPMQIILMLLLAFDVLSGIVMQIVQALTLLVI